MVLLSSTSGLLELSFAMKCPVCGCPGADYLLVTVTCCNKKCRCYNPSTIKYDFTMRTINGDPEREVHEFLTKVEGEK